MTLMPPVRITTLLFCAAACMGPASTAGAGTYYVSATAPSSATWAQAQSPATPCTADRAMANAAAGDTVYFRGGTYGSASTAVYYSPAQSGTATAEIHFTAYPGETPIVQAEFSVRDKQWLRFSGFTVRGSRTPPAGWRDMPAIVVDDPSVGPIDPFESWTTREAKVRRKYATYMAWYDSIFDQWTGGFSFSGCAHIVVERNTVSGCSAGIQFTNASSFVTVADNEVHHCYTGIFSYEPNYTSRASVTDAVVRGNHCTQNMDAGISLSYGARRILIEGNRCEFNAISHISTHHRAADFVIRGNTVVHAGHYTETMEWPGSSALSAGFGIDGLVLENNRASYQLDSTGVDGNGIIVDTNDDLGAITVPPVVRNNILYRNQGSGITVTRSARCTIVNNTCVENGYAAVDAYNGTGLRLSQSGTTATIAANNLFAGNSLGGLVVDTSFAAQSLIDYNFYETTGTGIVARDSVRSYTSLGAFYQATGREQHGVRAAAAFVGPTDFHLAATSPAIGAGSAVYAPSSDFDGTARDAAPDIGAFEYVALVPQTYATWRTANFTGADLANDAISGPDADPDAAGVTNLQRYAFALPARGPVANPITVGTTTVGSTSYLTLTFPRRTTASDLPYILESSADLVTWIAVPGRTYTAGSAPITAQDTVALGTASTPRRFLRLRITASP